MTRRHGSARRISGVVAAVSVAVLLGGLLASISPDVAAASLSKYTSASISAPAYITAGPDGALWFTNYDTSSIGRITTSGSVTNFTDPTINTPWDITSGPDGALWFTNYGNNSIGRINSSGTVTNFTDASISNPIGIVSGPDGALWFTNNGNDSIGRINTSGTVTNFTDASIAGPVGIVSGPDGALWFTNPGNASIGRITTSGSVTNFTDPTISQPYYLTSGPDGALWFTNQTTNTIGRISTSGVVTNFTDASIAGPVGIVSGQDGALWFTNPGNDSIGRITTSGTVTNYTDPSMADPQSIASGPDGALWFTNYGNNSIGRLGLPKANDACTVHQSCLAATGKAASLSNASESVVVTGTPDRGPGAVKLSFARGALNCPSASHGPDPVATLHNTGYSAKRKLRVTVTLRQIAGTGGAKVCFRSRTPFKSQSPTTSQPGGGTGLLLACASVKNVAPCVVSSKPVRTSIVVTFVVPGDDRGFQIVWPTGKYSWISQGHGSGTVGKAYSARFSARDGRTPYVWKVTSGKLPPGLTLHKAGYISGNPATSSVKGKAYTFKVQATSSDKPPQKTSSETAQITIR